MVENKQSIVSLLERGDNKINAIIGNNSSGKTTLLKELRQKSKKISFLNEDFNHYLKTEKLYLDQEIKLYIFNELNILDSNEEIILSSLSISQRKKIALALALSGDSKLILLDEPFLFLEPKDIKKTLRIIRYLKNKKQKTIFLVSVNPNYPYLIADDIIVINNQKIIFNGTKEEFFTHKDDFINKKIVLPSTTNFIHEVQKAKEIKLGNIDNNNDLIKAIYQNTKY